MPTIEQINAMSPEEIQVLNAQLSRRVARRFLTTLAIGAATVVATTILIGKLKSNDEATASIEE